MVGNTNAFFSTFEQCLHGICIQVWHARVEAMSHVNLYNGINYMSNYSFYLDKVPLCKHLISLSR